MTSSIMSPSGRRALFLSATFLFIVGLRYAYQTDAIPQHKWWSETPPKLDWTVPVTLDGALTDPEALADAWRSAGAMSSGTKWTSDNENTTPEYTAAILYLTRLSTLLETASSLESLALHMPMDQPYPILLLQEGDLESPMIQEEFRARWMARADEREREGETPLAGKMRAMGEMFEFPHVDLGAPTEMARLGVQELDPLDRYRWPGYHSMCRFFSIHIFTHPRVGVFDYYMRMDTDSYLLSPMAEDPFSRMRRQGSAYAWRGEALDSPDYCLGLLDFAQKHIDANPDIHVEPRVIENDKFRSGAHNGVWGWENNWEIVHLASFRRKDVKDWLDALEDHLLGFYKWRWGDSPIRHVTTMMFFPDKVEHYCDFAYAHKGSIQPRGGPECMER